MENYDHQGPRQVTFRLLCHSINVGGVIGHAGSVVKNIEEQASVRIRVRPSVPDCMLRIIQVTGSASMCRTVTLEGEGEMEVSPAQEGLFRVFKRVWEVIAERDGSNDKMRCCKLLADQSQIGVVMGKGGKNVSTISANTGARVWIMLQDQVPACASLGDQEIRITGRSLSVKKALYAVSCCLQDNPPLDKASVAANRPFKTAPQEDFLDPHAEFFPDLKSVLPVLENIGNPASSNHSTSPGMDRKVVQKEVIFKLLCSTGIVGGVIGKGGTIVRTLQNETGAFINFLPPVNGCNERVVIISGLEDPNSSHSPAQNAVVRVFARFMEVGISTGVISYKSEREIITARLLISSKQASFFKGGDNNMVSEMKDVTDAEIKILGCAPNCASKDDEIVQISGGYKNVQRALLQVTGRLRENYFPSTVLGGTGARSYQSYAIPDINPHRNTKKTNSSVSSHSSGRFSNFDPERIAWGLSYLGISDKFCGPNSARIQLPQDLESGNRKGSSLAENGFAENVELGSVNKVTYTAEEVVVPQNIFSCVCGEDGGNLNLMRQISGAQVEVQDPSPGKSEGKVIIYGSHEEILAAKSLLQAFIQSAN